MITSIYLIIHFSFGFVQQPDHWKTLADVKLVTKKVNNYEVDVPRFGENAKSLNGKRIKLKGYLIPTSELNGRNQFMLSLLPYSMCYFCSNAGPETIVELLTTESFKFETIRIEVEGNLILNETDPEHHIYILKDSKKIN
jgi:hypothetical protein